LECAKNNGKNREGRKVEIMSFLVFVVSSKKIGDEYYLTGLTENEKVFLVSKGNVKPGEIVEVDGKKKKDIFYVSTAEIKEKSESKEFLNRVRKLIEKNSEVLNEKNIFDDKIIKAMNNKICEIAEKIKESIFLNKPIIVRYHNDCDGICSAIALRKAIGKNSKFILNKFPYYRQYDMEKDLSEIKSLDYEFLNPLFIACDFGSNEECEESYKKLISEGFEIIVIDHHPPSINFNELKVNIINPHLFGGNSNYTAGLIASEVAYKILGEEGDLKKIISYSFAGDRSKFSYSDEDNKYALVLDYLCSRKSVDEVMDLLKDKEQITAIYAELTEKIESIKGFVLKKIKKKKVDQITLILINTDKIVKEGEYPTKGDIVGIVHDEILKKVEGVITIGYGKRSLNIRIDDKAISLGYDATKIIDSIKSENKEMIESAGGHKAAAGVRVKDDYSKLILKSLIEKIKKGGMA
jgi:RecJ-like exonuclease